MARIEIDKGAIGLYLYGRKTIVDLTIYALENADPHTFCRTRSKHMKDDFICGASSLWDRAVELAPLKGTEVRKEIEKISEEIKATKALLHEVNGFFQKLRLRWRLFRLRSIQFPLTDIIAMHVAEHGNNPAEKAELLLRLNQQIITLEGMYLRFEADIIRQIAPRAITPSEENYQSSEAMPCLRTFCQLAQEKSYTTEQMLEAWEQMLEMKMKIKQVNCLKWRGYLPLEQALYLLFEHLSYNDVKRCYLAFLELAQTSEN